MEPNYNPQNPVPEVNNAPKPGMGIASMVLGIVAVVFCCCFYYVSIPCAIVGLVLAIVVLRRGDMAGRKMAIAGLVLSIVALVLVVLYIILVGTMVGGLSAYLTELANYY